jgi:hypothetical protein
VEAVSELGQDWHSKHQDKERALDALVRVALHDEDETVAEAATAAVGRHLDPGVPDAGLPSRKERSLDAILAAMRDEDATVRERAVRLANEAVRLTLSDKIEDEGDALDRRYRPKVLHAIAATLPD